MDMSFNLGNVLTIISGIIAFVWQYSRMSSALERLEEHNEEIARGARDQELRVRALEIGATRTDEKLLSILAILQEIRSELRRGGA